MNKTIMSIIAIIVIISAIIIGVQICKPNKEGRYYNQSIR